MNDRPTITFHENSRFWDDTMSIIIAEVVKELACCLQVQSLCSKENLACTDPEESSSKFIGTLLEFLEKFKEFGILSRTFCIMLCETHVRL
jgi:hypothetical protein